MLGRHCIQRSLDVLPAVQRQALALVSSKGSTKSFVKHTVTRTLIKLCTKDVGLASQQVHTTHTKEMVWFSCLQVRQMLQRLVPSSPTFSGGNPVRCHVWHRGPAICTSRVVLYFFVFIGKGQNLGLASEHPTSLGVLATPAEQSVRRSVWGAFASKGWTRVNCSDVNDLTPKCRVVKSRAKIWKNIILLRDYELGEVVDIPQSHLPREMFLFLLIHV